MKKTITLALALLTFASVAQYNHTYDINHATSDIKPAFVITNKKAESITVSYGKVGVTPDIDYFIVTKHDRFGNVIYNNNIFPYFLQVDGITNVEALIQTDDEGLLIAGYHFDNEKHVEQPILIKLDITGNFEWSRIYYVNKYPIIGAEIGKISLCRVANEEKERYFIVAAGNSDVNPELDVATNVIKVDASGNMIFSKKYYDLGGSPFKILREYPGDMEFAKKYGMYMITGYRQQHSLTKGNVMYYFGIDKDGNVITKYLTLASKSIPVDQDMIYDAKNDVFATTFTHLKQGFETDPATVMGLVTIKPNLTITNMMYYWHQQGHENNARSISLCSSGEYLICEDIYDMEANIHNPGWLKVAPNGTPWAAIFSYNVKDNTVFGHHATTYNPDSGEDEYVLVNEQNTDLRVIRTKEIGSACGQVKWATLYEKYEAQTNTYGYAGRDVGEMKKYEIKYKIFEPDFRVCRGEQTPSYRPSTATGISQLNNAENTIAMYPSVISLNDARLTVENNAGAAVKLEVHNIAGQLISSTPVAQGKNEIRLNTNGNLSEGIYLVKVYGTDGSIATVNKILVTK